VNGAGAGGLAAWRFASRLARREVRRRPGRTLLVAVLVALPVLAMTVASVWARTEGGDTTLSRWRTGTDLVVYGSRAESADLSSALPAGATVRSIGVIESDIPIETASGDLLDSVMIAGSYGEPDGGHALAVTGGSAPTTGEAWLSDPLADRLDLEVGDELSLTHPAGTWTVSGVGRFDADFDRPVLVIDRVPLDQFRRGVVAVMTTVDLPGSPSPDHVESVGTALQTHLGDQPGSVVWPDQSGRDERTVDRSQLAWGWVAGALALAIMGIIIAAAFATSARRQLVTLGLLAANGASTRLSSRVLALQGFWTGLLGSIAGLAVGLGGLVVGRSVIEDVLGRVIAPYEFALSDLAVIAVTGVVAATIAALVPARTAARVPVAAALAGRRPLATVPRRLVPIGVALFLLGTFLLVVAASSNGGGNAVAAAAVLGGVLVLAGTCCASPLAIDTMSRVSARVGRSWRFAGRSVGRTRSRSAAVVTAIAVTGAAAVSGSTFALSAEESNDRFLPRDAVVLYQAPESPTPTQPGRTVDYAASSDTPVDTALQRQVNAVVPSARWAPLRIATWDAAPYRERRGPQAEDGGVALWPGSELVVADPAVVDLYELSGADRDALESAGVLQLDPWITDDGTVPEVITLVTEDGDMKLPFATRQWVLDQLEHPNEQIAFSGVRGMHPLMITEETARQAGLDIVTRGGIVRSDAPLTDGQKSDLDRIVYDGGTLGFFYRDVPRPDQTSPWSVAYGWTSPRLSRAAMQAAIVGGALLLTLLVVAIGLSLSATESRDERDVLMAVGARPATMRRMSGIKAAVITLTGVLLAIPTGVIPVAAVKRTLDDPFAVPWLAIAGLVVLLPVIAGVAAWAATGIAQRARPIRISNLAFE
jgi:putative ABC transport system permease protein